MPAPNITRSHITSRSDLELRRRGRFIDTEARPLNSGRKKRKVIRIDSSEEEEEEEEREDKTKTKRDDSDTSNSDSDDSDLPPASRPSHNITSFFKPRPHFQTHTDPQVFIPTHLQLTSAIPTFKIATYNITSLSAYAKDNTSDTRRKRVLDDIRRLTESAHAIFIQETKLNLYGGYLQLEQAHPSWKFHYNNPNDNTGGTLIMLSPTIRYHYTDTPDPIDPQLIGQAHSVKLVGINREGFTPLPLRLINVYLATGPNHHARRAAQLKRLLKIPADCHTILGGDFNFVERPADTTNFSSYHQLKKGKKFWERFKGKHGFWEVEQDTHTNIARNKDDPTNIRTSRIDRFYITHNEADCALHTPQTNVTNTPHSILNTLSPPPHKPHISTHAALTLSFISTDITTPHTDYKLPPWITHTPTFREIFRNIWQDANPGMGDPFGAEILFKRTARKAHKIFKSRQAETETSQTGKLDSLSARISLLRAMTTLSLAPNIATIRTRYPEISSETPEGPDGIEHLRKKIAKTFEKGEPGPAFTSHHRTEEDRSEGAAIYRQHRAPPQPTDPVKYLLPSTKKPLLALRATKTDDVTTDPPKQAKIIKTYWGPIWSERTNAPPQRDIDYLLSKYTKRIHHSHRPVFPTLKKIELFLSKTKNTAPGPDGIPFALYRNLGDLAAPMLLDIIIEMASGTPPPKEFNLGSLCIFPKGGADTIDRTRPITLNNTSNRVIASIIADSIMEAVDSIADKRQKGFIRGRHGGDNILELTNSFYRKLNAQQQHYYLFIDTAKAFDSLDHKYLFSVLDRIGMPSWVINIVRGLMTDVRVRPKLPGRIRTTIPIKRGVKQGCPLSPLLFILAYDPLLDSISQQPGAIVWSFADDAVMAHSSLAGIRQFTQTLDEFARISGFGVNRSKCSVLHTIEATPQEQAELDQAGWKDLSFTSTATYLGVLVGYNISTIDIFKDAVDKFIDRSESYSSALRHLPTQARVRVFNIYIIPLLSYLFQFYILPHKELGNRLRDIIRRKVISFNGGAHKYIHLITPSTKFGLTSPLRDIWALNITTLASQFNFSSLEGATTATAPGLEYLTTPGEWNGLAIDAHIACAALDLVNNIIPHKDGRFDIAPLDVSKYKPHRQQAQLRRKIYKLALTAYDIDTEENLSEKMSRMNMHPDPSKPLTPAQNFQLHGHNIHRLIPPHFRITQRSLIFNALATDTRIKPPLKQRGPPSNPHPCYICRHGPDTISHIFGQCPGVTSARSAFGRRIGITLKSDPKHFGLACRAAPTPQPGNADEIDPSMDAPNPPSHNPLRYTRRTNATIIFNYTVWHSRRTFFKTRHTHTTTDTTHNRLLEQATMYWNRYTPAPWHTTRDHTPPHPLIIDSSSIGKAGKRTPAQNSAARAYGRELLASIPPHHHIAYTDGSASRSTRAHAHVPGTPKIVNTGPCGSGVHYTFPKLPGKKPIDSVCAIKKGTNNIGELYAIGVALHIFLQQSEEGDHLDILSDSKLSTLIVEYGAQPKANRALVKSVLKIYFQARSRGRVRIHWVPAHVGMVGNETADVLADEGSRIAGLGGGLSTLDWQTRAWQGQFLVPHNHRHHPPDQQLIPSFFAAHTRPPPEPPPPKRRKHSTPTSQPTIPSLLNAHQHPRPSPPPPKRHKPHRPPNPAPLRSRRKRPRPFYPEEPAKRARASRAPR